MKLALSFTVSVLLATVLTDLLADLRRLVGQGVTDTDLGDSDPSANQWRAAATATQSMAIVKAIGTEPAIGAKDLGNSS